MLASKLDKMTIKIRTKKQQEYNFERARPTLQIWSPEELAVPMKAHSLKHLEGSKSEGFCVHQIENNFMLEIVNAL